MTKPPNYEAEFEELKKRASEARADGLSSDEEKELNATLSEIDASFERLRGAQEKMENEFFALVGKAISLWAHLESLLIGMASLLLRARPEKVGAVLYSIQNFHVWLNIIDELFSIDKQLRQFSGDWPDISSKLRSLNDIRVRLAHNTFFHDQSVPGMPTLKPGRFDTRSKSMKSQPVGWEQVIEFIEKINSVTPPLLSLNKLLLAQLRALHGKPSPRPVDPPGEGAQ